MEVMDRYEQLYEAYLSSPRNHVWRSMASMHAMDFVLHLDTIAWHACVALRVALSKCVLLCSQSKCVLPVLLLLALVMCGACVC